MPLEPDSPKFEKLPVHIAIIMDGNGRWAAARHLPRMAGHRAGTENLRQIIRACVEFGIQYLTIYAFSTENWKRPQDEVSGLMQILAESLEKELGELHKQGVRLNHIGRLEHLDKRLGVKISDAIRLTRNNNRLTLNIAWNYGGRDEIVYAVQQILKEKTPPEEVSEDTISDHLFTRGIPDPDLVIRTSGEQRTSNFLVWQSAYAEWYFTPILWPDFDKEALREALDEYGRRSRRFGGRTTSEEQEKYAG
ncbi:MAG: isoprenyl transferase [Chloroflexi bacterium]|nr:isoprenyl transferase [Chloroflexota bacterium]